MNDLVPKIYVNMIISLKIKLLLKFLPKGLMHNEIIGAVINVVDKDIIYENRVPFSLNPVVVYYLKSFYNHECRQHCKKTRLCLFGAVETVIEPKYQSCWTTESSWLIAK